MATDRETNETLAREARERLKVSQLRLGSQLGRDIGTILADLEAAEKERDEAHDFGRQETEAWKVWKQEAEDQRERVAVVEEERDEAKELVVVYRAGAAVAYRAKRDAGRAEEQLAENRRIIFTLANDVERECVKSRPSKQRLREAIKRADRLLSASDDALAASVAAGEPETAA